MEPADLKYSSLLGQPTLEVPVNESVVVASSPLLLSNGEPHNFWRKLSIRIGNRTFVCDAHFFPSEEWNAVNEVSAELLQLEQERGFYE